MLHSQTLMSRDTSTREVATCKVGGWQTSSNLRNNHRECLSPPSLSGQNSKERSDMFAFQSVHRITLFREGRLILNKHGVWRLILSHLHKPRSPVNPLVCAPCSINLPFIYFQKQQWHCHLQNFIHQELILPGSLSCPVTVKGLDVSFNLSGFQFVVVLGSFRIFVCFFVVFVYRLRADDLQ